ncbi:MAG: hypothetical protein V4772_02465, partial [Pseudomonadota bacterium]
MSQSDPKYVSAPQPVNRRTAKPEARTEQINPVVQERLAAKWANQQIKGRFGAPLAEQLQVSVRPTQTPAISPLFITGGVVSAVSAVGLLLAAIQHSLLLAGAGTLAFASGAGLMFLSRRSGAMAELAVPAATALFDETSLLAFDRALESMAADAPDAVVTALTGIKQQLVRIAQHAANAPIDEHFTMDDRLYLTELLRRYLPDSLHAYLMVPKDQRSAQVLERGETAASLLLGQLKLLGTELDKREKKLTKSKAENLL